MKKINEFYYPTSFIRSDTEGKGRTYDVKDQIALASVTTILGDTKDKSFLKDWKKRVGEHSMAKQIIKNGLEGRLEGYYGIEALMYYPGLYAGSADLVGLHEGEIAIIDFKQTNKPKREEWIEDYFLQLSAYAMAHDFVYKTAIDKAVIMMCSVDNYYQEWIISGAELRDWKHKFLARVDQYYGQIDQGL
jgi:genome maintenance exonuclease 1